MGSGDYGYIWQASDWPIWRFDWAALAAPMAEVSRAQGLLLGRLADGGMALRDHASLAALTEDVVKTSEIEGERLNVESVRSSIARRLGVDIGALAPLDQHVEGVAEMVLDATANCHAPLSRGRLFGWHAALFPTGYGLARIKVGGWRDDASGPMQVAVGGRGWSPGAGISLIRVPGQLNSESGSNPRPPGGSGRESGGLLIFGGGVRESLNRQGAALFDQGNDPFNHRMSSQAVSRVGLKLARRGWQ